MAKLCLTYLCSVEGLQEKRYLEHVQKLINMNDLSKYRVNFIIKDATGGSPLNVCQKAARNFTFQDKKKMQRDGRVFSVFDYDFKDASFVQAINFCQKEKIGPIYSNVCFDLWLILHKRICAKKVTSSTGLQNDVIQAFRLKQNVDIKSDDVIKLILQQIELEDIKNAILNANKVNKKTEEDNERVNGCNAYTQPYTNVVKFIEGVLNECKLL